MKWGNRPVQRVAVRVGYRPLGVRQLPQQEYFNSIDVFEVQIAKNSWLTDLDGQRIDHYPQPEQLCAASRSMKNCQAVSEDTGVLEDRQKMPAICSPCQRMVIRISTSRRSRATSNISWKVFGLVYASKMKIAEVIASVRIDHRPCLAE